LNWSTTDDFIVVGEDGTLTVGVEKTSTDANEYLLLDNFRLTYYGPAPITVTITDAKFATFIAPADVTTEGSNTTAYKVTKLHDGWVTMEEVAEVPAGAAVVVGADEAGTYTLKRNAAAALDGNILTYSADPISVATAKTYYGLSKGSKGTGFYPVKVGATIAANKPYFLNEDAGAKDFYSLFEDPTGIEGVIIEKLDGTQEIYNVRGQRLNKLERGINIVNGKKVILK
jgi:hypothetical protein